MKCKCEMSIISYENGSRSTNICAMTHWVKPCEGTTEQTRNCPLWKGSGQE